MCKALVSGTHKFSTGASAQTVISAIMKALQPVPLSNGPLLGNVTD